MLLLRRFAAAVSVRPCRAVAGIVTSSIEVAALVAVVVVTTFKGRGVVSSVVGKLGTQVRWRRWRVRSRRMGPASGGSESRTAAVTAEDKNSADLTRNN